MADNKYTPNPRKYSKTNFVELIEIITPEIYKTEDLKLSGTELNPVSQVINSHLNVANNISTVIPLSAVQDTQTSTLNSITGISQYFVKQNRLTNISPFDFESKILLPLSSTLANFDTSADFNTYLSGTLLPMIIPAAGVQNQLNANITTLSSLTNSTDPSSVHNYLVDALGWMYFLNTSANGGLTYSPSSFVLNSLNSLYLGNSLETIDGIKGLVEYLWRNNETCSFGSYLPSNFVSGIADGITDSSAGVVPTYTSGTQKLEALQTLVDVVYSPLYIDEQDFTVQDAFTSYIDANVQLDNRSSKGPYRKFLNLLGYSTADISDQVDNIELIYDIENVKPEHLQYIAELIGFKLRGSSASKWRHQLRIAMDLYKSKGTLDSIQIAMNALITDSVFDLSGKVEELWESYLPFLIWYALGTESPEFRDLTTWTVGRAEEAGVTTYSTSSLEENLKIVVDSILLDLYKAFPDNFIFHGKRFSPPTLVNVDIRGCEEETYTIIGDPHMKPFHFHAKDSNGFKARKQDAKLFGESLAFDAASGLGALGLGVYMAGADHPADGSRPVYLKPAGDLDFLFNYRGRVNYPIPPFEEVKYYRDSNISAEMVSFLVERLKCFNVKDSFADEVGNYVLSSAVTDESDLGALNEMLMLFSSVQVPSNFDDVMLSISDYEKNLLNLWNGKSSHLFINFIDTDLDFSKTTLEGDGKYALFEASRVIREFAPGHAIPKVNLSASATEPVFDISSARFLYAGLDKDDTRALYTSASILGNFEWSGAAMCFDSGGGDGNQDSSGGRDAANTFKRPHADQIIDSLLSGVNAVVDLGSVPRRALRRRNLKYLLPLEGYYDRTGFNGPVSYDPSTFEPSFVSSLGELTLGYVASAGKFHPVCDPVDPTGVWEDCEKLTSTNTFSGIDTSSTFPYRGLHTLGSNNKRMEVASATARYVDRGQVPIIYNTMHELFEAKALDNGYQILSSTSEYDSDAYWKNNAQSLANSSIADGYVLNSFADYENFKFGSGLQRTHRDYCKYFAKHPLGFNEAIKTGGNIIAQVFGKGLFNCDFDIAGSGASSLEGNYIASSVTGAVPIAYNSGSGVFSTCAVASYGSGIASGTYIAYGPGESVLPLTGTYVSPINVNTAQQSDPNPFNAEFRNPNILSGIEFVQTSGAPNANQFAVFKLDSSNATPGMENALINNSVIKCKSLGGLPRLRFDLSSYGDRPNHFIKDHKFKLNVKSLVAEENSPVLGGGKLGVWIHTKPKYLGNPNLLAYTEDLGGSPGLDMGVAPTNGSSIDIEGSYWQGNPGNCGTLSSTLETNPFGGPSSTDFSATQFTTGRASLIELGLDNERNPVFKEAYYTIQSWYIKKPATNASLSFKINNYDHNLPLFKSNEVTFGWDGNEAIISVETSINSGYVESVGNDWYRCSITTSGLGEGAGNESEEGDKIVPYLYLDHVTTDPIHLYVSSPQLEQKLIGAGDSLPSPYQAVSGNIPAPVTPKGYLWSWTPNGKWEVTEESKLSIRGVKNSLAHIYKFETSIPTEETYCFGNNSEANTEINNKTLKNIKDEYFENFEIEFDTRNFTINNNFEYLDIIPIKNDVYEVTEQVNTDDTNYIVEVFFVPNNNPDKYLLLDSIELQDVTQRENTAIGTGHGIETSGIPHRPFVKEDKLYLDKDQLLNTLKFYNGLIGQGTGVYATNLASRDATITSGTLELSGGSRLNYRIQPDWTPGVTTQSNYLNYTNVEFDN
jgi:hypothetical protein